MERIKFERIVSVNSEVPGHEAQTLLSPSVNVGKSWQAEKGTEKGRVILKLERPAVITKVDVGNAHSAFIEVLCGCASDHSDQFETLIPTGSYMSPNDSKSSTNPNKVRFFTSDDFEKDARKKKWDLIKIVCSQPFVKVPYGICFIAIHGEAEKSLLLPVKPVEEPSISVGSFFRKKMEETAETDKPLSISERIREAEKPSALAKHIPLTALQISEKEPKKGATPKRQIDDDDDDDAVDNRRNVNIGLDDSPSNSGANKTDEKIDEAGDKETNTAKQKEDKEEREKNRQKRHEPRDDDEGMEGSEDEEAGKSKKKDEDKEKDRQKRQDTRPSTSRDSPRTPKDGDRGKKKDDEERRRHSEHKRKKDRGTDERKADRGRTGNASQAVRKRKPLRRLLEDVVFVLSGYQNPERATYRSHALALGAKYSQDWQDGRCTHLVAAYINTPKCNQVKGKGKIVSKDWIEKCYNDKKRYPWRRFALDKKDRQRPESEEEIEAGDEDDATSSSARGSQGESSQEKKKDATQNSDEAYDASTDDDDVEGDRDENGSKMPTLPDLLRGESFYVDSSVSDKAVLERYIIAYNGSVQDKLDEKVKYFITMQRGKLLDAVREKMKNLKIVSPSWIQAVNCAQKYVSPDDFLVD